jgi:hypothetical protein
VKLTSLFTRVKRHQWRENVSGVGQPLWTIRVPKWNDSASGAGPAFRLQRCRKFYQPGRLNGNVIVHEREHITARLTNTSIEGTGFPLLRLEQISETAGMATRKILHDIARSIARIIVYNENFPWNRGRELRSRHAIQRCPQAFATIISAENDGNPHLRLFDYALLSDFQ